MTNTKKWMTAAGILMLPLSAQAASPITGRWVTQSKDGVVEVYPCGENICGKLSKFLVNPPAGPGAGVTAVGGVSASGVQAAVMHRARAETTVQAVRMRRMESSRGEQR